MDANTAVAHGEAIGHVVLDVGRLVFEKAFEDAVGGGAAGTCVLAQTRTLQLLEEDGQDSGRAIDVCWSYVADAHPGGTLGDEM